MFVSDSIRFRLNTVSPLVAVVFGAAIGCAPPAPPMVSEQEMAVGIPVGRTSDTGVLVAAEIEPPELSGLEQTEVQSISMRFGEATDLVQTFEEPAEEPAEEPVAELVEEPAVTELVEELAADSETPMTTLVQVEIIDPPSGEPIETTPKTTATPPASPKSDVGGKLELIPTPKGEPDREMAKEDAVPATKSDVPPAAMATDPSASLNPATPGADEAVKADPKQTTSAASKSDSKGLTSGVDGPEDYRTWEIPAVTLVFTGQQHGYIEPCGCTGLDRQKGGIARRYTFIESLTEKGWNVVPMDAGNQVRRFGKQAAIKLQQTVRALNEMNYQAVGFGPDDVRLGVGDLLALAVEQTMFVSANVVLFDPEYLPKTKLIESGGMKIGVTSVLDPDALEVAPDDALAVNGTEESATAAVAELAAQSPDFSVLLYFGKEDAAKELVTKVAGFDLVVVAGGFGEPTYQAESIDGSKTRIIVTGDKGMYAGMVGLYPGSELKYARVPLTHEFSDAPQMRGVMKDYQDQLRDLGLGELGLLPPIKHSSGQKFVGTETCGKCHTNALAIWESSAHAEATEHLVNPPKERSDIARHFDPECLSCHVTGWNPQEYYPYETGYLSLEETPHLTGNGCENCHGPGAAHAAAEEKDSPVAAAMRDQLRESMKLPLEKAREKCMSCHDLDNSPDFHDKDAFEDVYWPEVEHYGLD